MHRDDPCLHFEQRVRHIVAGAFKADTARTHLNPLVRDAEIRICCNAFTPSSVELAGSALERSGGPGPFIIAASRHCASLESQISRSCSIVVDCFCRGQAGVVSATVAGTTQLLSGASMMATADSLDPVLVPRAC